MPSACDECRSNGEEMGAWHAMQLENLQKEIQSLRAEQLKVNEQLLSGVQILVEAQTEPCAEKRSFSRMDSPRLDTRDPQSSRSLNLPSEAGSRGKRATTQGSRQSHQSHKSIPELVDLEKTLVRDSSIMSGPGYMRSSRVRPELHPVLQADPQPPTSQTPAFPPSMPPSMSRRGSELKILAKASESRILSPRERQEFAWNVFQDNIGVSMWLNWSNFISVVIVLLNLMYLVPMTILQLWRHQPGEHLAAFGLLMYSIVAILLLQLVKRSLRSVDLNVAMHKLDGFVQHCGHGLDWPSVSKKCWHRSLAMWLLVVLAFVVEQALEAWKTAGFALESLGNSVNLEILKASTSCLLFAVSSSVVMNGAYFQLTLMLGLGKTLDCWCADLMEDQDFIAHIKSWNSLQALLKSVGREVTSSFSALYFFGYAGFLAAMVGSISLLLDPNLDGATVALYESSLLPLIFLFFLSARLLTSGAGLSEKCQQIPAFVNQLSCGAEEPDAERQYLVRYISYSRAGFIVYGVTLSQTAVLKQAHILFALCSGVAGILMRRYL